MMASGGSHHPQVGWPRQWLQQGEGLEVRAPAVLFPGAISPFAFGRPAARAQMLARASGALRLISTILPIRGSAAIAFPRFLSAWRAALLRVSACGISQSITAKGAPAPLPEA